MTLDEIISDAAIIRVHGNANFGSMDPREVVNDGVRKSAIGYHCGHTQVCILREHGLITKSRGMSFDVNLTKKGKRYARALCHDALFRAHRPVEQEAVAWRIDDLILQGAEPRFTTDRDYARRTAEYRYEGEATAKVTALYAASPPSRALSQDVFDQARIDYLRTSRDGHADRAHRLYTALVEVRDSVETYPLDDTSTCMCGSPVEGHNIGSGHAPVSQADHAISLIVEAIDKALGHAAIPDDALMGTGRPDDYEGPDAGMHDTEIEDRAALQPEGEANG